MRPDDLLQRLECLISQADGVSATKRVTTHIGHMAIMNPTAWIDRDVFMQWATSGLHAVRLSFGDSSDHYRSMKMHVDAFDGEFSTFQCCLGIVRAARDDLAGGFMVSVRELATAEVFDDLLEMAKHLQENGFFLASVAITGGVLEDALRKLHSRHLPAVPVPDQINPLNEGLRQAGVYAQPQWREVQAWGDLRNDADHLRLSNSANLKVIDGDGNHQPEIDPRQVARMIEGVRDFLAKHLS